MKIHRKDQKWTFYVTPFKVFCFCICSRNQALRLKASNSSLGLAQEHVSQNAKNVGKIDSGQDLFADMKQRFLDFKKHKYTWVVLSIHRWSFLASRKLLVLISGSWLMLFIRKELEHFQTIAEAQYPKVINKLNPDDSSWFTENFICLFIFELDALQSLSCLLQVMLVWIKSGKYVELTKPRTVYGDCLCRLQGMSF